MNSDDKTFHVHCWHHFMIEHEDAGKPIAICCECKEVDTP